MRVFKFGGASVKDAEGLKNMASIIQSYSGELIIVISAMGKTTNALEKVVSYFFSNHKKEVRQELNRIKEYHFSVISKLEENSSFILNQIAEIFNSLETKLFSSSPSLDYDFEYDQIVSYGEIISSKIASFYLSSIGFQHRWVDIRKCLKTDDTWREGAIDWELSSSLVPQYFNPAESKAYLTQGFIAATPFNSTTTLGREGSDYSAAILANLLDAESLTIWKDVPGIMTADPHKFGDTQKMERLSYREAVEMTYFGAKIIHPKTMKPLVDKNIPLYVKSFYQSEESGSVVHNFEFIPENVPVIIVKENQVLVTVSSRDLSFIAEDHIARVYRLLSLYRMRVNLVQQSAMSISFSIDRPERNLEKLIAELMGNFNVRFNENLELLTIRNYTQTTIENMTWNRKVFVEQRTRRTARFLLMS